VSLGGAHADLGGTLWGEDAAVRSSRTPMQLHMMRDQGLSGRGAVCLDGLDAGFYFAPAADSSNANNWQIYFQGGGWCYDEMDCWGRSNGILGSSKDWPNQSSLGGIMSDDCEVNPDFCNYNRAQLAYCDGNSFSGDRDEPIVVTGLDGKPKPIYFRGKRIIDAVLGTLLKMGLDKAEKVLLTGCSAGGLATYLHTDYVHNFLQSAGVPLKTFKSAPISGLFLLHQTVDGRPVYETQMREIFKLANSSGGVHAGCIAAMSAADAWKCNFAQFAYAHTESPIFALNSALDSWQTSCIYTSDLAPGFPAQKTVDNGECSAQGKGALGSWKSCVLDVESCTEAQMTAMNSYMVDFTHVLQGAGTYAKLGNGAFVPSCSTHCEAQDDHAWSAFKISGVSMKQAVSRWWHSYIDCLYHPETSPHRCNPTCAMASSREHSVLVV